MAIRYGRDRWGRSAGLFIKKSEWVALRKQPGTTYMGGLSHRDEGKSMLLELRFPSSKTNPDEGVRVYVVNGLAT